MSEANRQDAYSQIAEQRRADRIWRAHGPWIESGGSRLGPAVNGAAARQIVTIHNGQIKAAMDEVEDLTGAGDAGQTPEDRA